MGTAFSDTKEAYIISLSISVIMNTIIVILIEGAFFFRQWKYSLIEAERFKKESIVAKYETLRSQVSPHFLFNSLNTLSNLISDEDGDAKEFVDDFSDVYRYVLTSREKEVVKLSEELAFLRSYINLLEKRHGQSVQFNLAIADKHLTQRIPPLTVQFLVENAVKHNIASRRNPLKVNISVENKRPNPT